MIREVMEYEKRWSCSGIDPSITLDPENPTYDPKRILQGYYETPLTFDDPDAEVMRVRLLQGLERVESEIVSKVGPPEARCERGPGKFFDIPFAEYLYDKCLLKVTKTRYDMGGGTTIDIFDRIPLILVETEYPHGIPRDAAPPHWALDPHDVTHTLNSRHVARMLLDLYIDPFLPLDHLMPPKRLFRVVFTGGPGSGKDGYLHHMERKFGELVHVVPEAADILFGRAKVIVAGSKVEQRQQQRTLYRIQCGLESECERHARSRGKSVMAINRGRADNAAYLEGHLKELQQIIPVSIKELYRYYDLVICFEVAPPHVYEQIKNNTESRRETYEQAVERGRLVEDAWSGHPNFHYIRNNGDDWDSKVRRADELFESYLRTVFKI